MYTRSIEINTHLLIQEPMKKMYRNMGFMKDMKFDGEMENKKSMMWKMHSENLN